MYNKLIELQAKVKAPKGQTNNFGKYKYRNIDDILEAAKPAMAELGLALLLTDTIEQIGDRYYVKATALLTDGKATVENTAYAREPISKKGMDEAQVTGTSSTYARKYALAGLLLLDDSKDADSASPENNDPVITKQQAETVLTLLNDSGRNQDKFMEYFQVKSIDNLTNSQFQQAVQILKAKAA